MDFSLILVIGYFAMHCRYFTETKTLWEHLNSSANTFIWRRRDNADLDDESISAASMSIGTQLGADHA